MFQFSISELPFPIGLSFPLPAIPVFYFPLSSVQVFTSAKIVSVLPVPRFQMFLVSRFLFFYKIICLQDRTILKNKYSYHNHNIVRGGLCHACCLWPLFVTGSSSAIVIRLTFAFLVRLRSTMGNPPKGTMA